MSANMFSLLADEPVAASKPAAAAAAASSKPAQKALVGGAKKGDSPKQAASPQQTSRGTLPGEVRKDFNKGPRKTHQPRTDANGKIRGREFDRHVSGTGRIPGENKRGGAGRNNWGPVKNAQADEEAAVEANEAEAAVVNAEATTAPVEGTEPVVDAAPKAEPEPETKSFASYQAEKAKKEAELLAALGLAPQEERRVVAPAWYKPAEKKTAAAAPKASSSKDKEQKQAKTFVPVSQIIGEKREQREERPFRPRDGPRDGARDGPREHREPREPREHREPREPREPREGSSAERAPRQDRAPRQGGDRDRAPRQGGNNKKAPRKTFDATADADSLPALGQ